MGVLPQRGRKNDYSETVSQANTHYDLFNQPEPVKTRYVEPPKVPTPVEMAREALREQ